MTPGELSDWLVARGAVVCPVCGTNEWIAESLANDNQKLKIVSVTSEIGDSFNDDGRRVATAIEFNKAVMLSCSNCGFMRLHNARIVGAHDGDAPRDP